VSRTSLRDPGACAPLERWDVSALAGANHTAAIENQVFLCAKRRETSQGSLALEPSNSSLARTSHQNSAEERAGFEYGPGQKSEDCNEEVSKHRIFASCN
jgi:hypothetical protein